MWWVWKEDWRPLSIQVHWTQLMIWFERDTICRGIVSNCSLTPSSGCWILEILRCKHWVSFSSHNTSWGLPKFGGWLVSMHRSHSCGRAQPVWNTAYWVGWWNLTRQLPPSNFYPPMVKFIITKIFTIVTSLFLSLLCAAAGPSSLMLSLWVQHPFTWVLVYVSTIRYGSTRKSWRRRRILGTRYQ